MILDWLSGKAALRYPVPPAPRTAVLVPFLRPKAQVRVFPEGWRQEVEAFQPAALAGDWAQFEALLGRPIPCLTHAIVVLARSPEELLSEGQRRELWRAFRVPVFEQILAGNGSVLAAECEAHDGLHVEPAGSPVTQRKMRPARQGYFNLLTSTAPDALRLAAELGCGEGIAVAFEPCGCGRTTPRLKRLSNCEQILCEPAEKIEKVPSDLQDNLFSGRHARPERGAQKRRDVSPQLPAAGFAQRRITAPVRIRNSAFGGSSPLDTAFHSPATTACLAVRSPQPRQRSWPTSSKQF